MNFDHETDPYGSLEYCVGSSDDFWCFDYAWNDKRNHIRLHAVVNGEAGAFIQNAESPMVVHATYAVDAARGLIDRALKWCDDGEIVHDIYGWNQSPCYFWRNLMRDINGIEKPVPRIVTPMLTWRRVYEETPPEGIPLLVISHAGVLQNQLYEFEDGCWENYDLDLPIGEPVNLMDMWARPVKPPGLF